MGLERNVSLMTALRYKGQGPFLTFILHRIGGMGMAVFITIHMLASFAGDVMRWRIGFYANAIYENPIFQLFIFFCVLFHAINGLRITILDLFPSLIPHHRRAIQVEWVVFFVLYGLSAIAIIRTAAGG